MKDYILFALVAVWAAWHFLELPKVWKETKEDIKEIDKILEANKHFHCTDCNHSFNTPKHESDPVNDEWVDSCPYCGSTYYESNEQNHTS